MHVTAICITLAVDNHSGPKMRKTIVHKIFLIFLLLVGTLRNIIFSRGLSYFSEQHTKIINTLIFVKTENNMKKH